MESLQQVKGNKTSGICKSNIANRMVYGFFVAFGLIDIFQGKTMDAATYLGLALAFDPFDSSVPWKVRPLYQRVWLFVHLIIVFALFISGVFIK